MMKIEYSIYEKKFMLKNKLNDRNIFFCKCMTHRNSFHIKLINFILGGLLVKYLEFAIDHLYKIQIYLSDNFYTLNFKNMAIHKSFSLVINGDAQQSKPISKVDPSYIYKKFI